MLRSKYSSHNRTIYRDQDYSLDKDPLILMKMQKICKDHDVRQIKLDKLLPTTSSNKDLYNLEVNGSSVFENEKASAEALIEQIKSQNSKQR